ncbi:MAG: LamG domain-containing protein, partial [Nitrosarchaeum sp.]
SSESPPGQENKENKSSESPPGQENKENKSSESTVKKSKKKESTNSFPNPYDSNRPKYETNNESNEQSQDTKNPIKKNVDSQNKKSKDTHLFFDPDDYYELEGPITFATTALNSDISAITISAWVKPNYASGVSTLTIIDKKDSFNLSINNVISPRHAVSFSVYNGLEWITINSYNVVPENEWSHIAVTIDENKVSLYLNRNLEDNSSLSSTYFVFSNFQLIKHETVYVTDNDMIIGAQVKNGRTTNKFYGELGDIIIYNSAFTLEQIQELYSKTVFDNSESVGVIYQNLSHDPIEINQPVDWNLDVEFDSSVSSSAFDLPNDATLISVIVTDSDGTTTTLFNNQISKDIKIIDSTTTSNVLKTLKKVNDFIIVNIDGEELVYSSLDFNSEYFDDDGLRKIIVVNHEAKTVSITFRTGDATVTEEGSSDSDTFSKTIKVSHESSLHYTDVQTCSDIPEELVESNASFTLNWIVNNELIDVINDPEFNVTFKDRDGNGVDDTMCWTVPKLSEQNFVITADLSIINVHSYPVVGNRWDVGFTTTGTADLLIEGIDGTTFGNSSPDDLKFLELSDGTNKLTPTIQGNSILYPNYSSAFTGRFSSEVITTGEHNLKFTFGSDVKFVDSTESITLTDSLPISVSKNCNSPTTLATLATELKEGTHVIMASTQFTRTNTGASTVNVWLEDNSGNVIARNSMLLELQSTNSHTGYVLLGQNTGKSNESYKVKSCGTQNNILGEAKITAFEMERTKFIDGDVVDILGNQIKSLGKIETDYPAGDNVLLLSLQIDNGATPQIIPPGSIKILNRFNEIVATNQYRLNLGAVAPTDIQSLFLVTTDFSAPQDSTYEVTFDSALSSIKGEVKILAIQPAAVFFNDGIRIALDSSVVNLASISTEYDVGDDVVVLSAGQFDDEDSGIEKIIPSQYNINENGIPVSGNEFELSSQGGASAGSNFAYSLIYRTIISQPNSVFIVNAGTSQEGLVGESKLISFIPKDAGPSPGPIISSIEAGGTGLGFSDGDTITVVFSEATNRPNAAEKTSIDSLFTFLKNGNPVFMGNNYVGSWTSPTTLVLTFVDTAGHGSPSVGTLQIKINEPSLIKNEDSSSLSSVGTSPYLSGDLGTPLGPSIISITASDLSPVVSGFSNGDIITVRFSEDTNRPDPTPNDGKLTKSDLDSLFDYIQGQNALPSLGANYEGVWEKPRTLVITILDSTGSDLVLGGLKIKSDPLSSTPIKNSDSTSKPSNSTSSVLQGTWGQGVGPYITSFVAEDPDGGDAVFGNGDVLSITFSEATNKPDASSINNLFTFIDGEKNTISLGTVSSQWLDSLTLRLTIDNSAGNTVNSAIGSIKAQTLSSGNIKNALGTSLPSESLSPPLSGDFGQKEGPSIITVTASGETLGINSDDKLTVKFSERTNRPSAGTVSEVKKLLKVTDLSGSELILGSEFSGKWVSSSILEIIVVNPSGNNCSTLFGNSCDVNGKIKVALLSSGELKNELSNSKSSISISPPATGSFGIKEGPSIISVTASDPGEIVPGFSNGDTIRLRFSEPTNMPFGNTAVLTKSDVDSMFLFSQSLSDGYTGKWISSQTFTITITDDIVDSPPKIGDFRITAKSSGNIQSEGGSTASKSTSPPLEGTFGDKTGPSIVSVTARDPFGDDAVVDKGDILLIKFAESTNMSPINLVNTKITKSQVDSLISFTHVLGTDYTGMWIDPTTFRITLVDVSGSTMPITNGLVDSTFRLQIKAGAALKDSLGTSLNSISQSSSIQGTFGSKQGPHIVSMTIGDPLSNTGYSSGDEIRILFSESTNQPSVSDVNSLLTFKTSVGGSSINLGTTLTGVWLNPTTLKITIVNSVGETMPEESNAIGVVVAEIKGTAKLKDAAGTSFSSISISPPLQGTFGLSPGPSIKSLVADDPDSLDSVYSNGDVINLRFSEPTNKKDPTPGDGLTRQDLDKLFTFTQSIGDGYSGNWIDSINLQIIINEITLEQSPEINELRVIAKASGNIQAQGGSLASTSTSPVLTGTFGNFVEDIPVSDGGTATTTLPSGIVTSLSLNEGTSGTFTMESTELDVSDPDTAVIGILGDTVEITPQGESPCTVDDPCVIEFIFDLVDLQSQDPPLTLDDVRIIHDMDDDGVIESPNEAGENEVLETTITQLDANTYLASASIDHFSKFAVGGVKALALGALAGSINTPNNPGNTNAPSSPNIGKTLFNSLGDSSSGFAGILDPISLESLDEKLLLPTQEYLMLNVDLYEDQGITNVKHVEIYFDFGGLLVDEESITSIVYEKDRALVINDPKQFFSEASLDIKERDAYNGVLQLKVKFQKPMDTSSIKIVVWDLERNTSTKTFENIVRIESKQQINKEIPKWVKTSAGWWSNDQISDGDFIQGIEFLIKENIIPVKNIETTESSSAIPSWIKNNAKWWSEDLITDAEFVSGVEQLIKTGIISVSNP